MLYLQATFGVKTLDHNSSQKKTTVNYTKTIAKVLLTWHSVTGCEKGSYAP
jgi:hypothetical protein